MQERSEEPLKGFLSLTWCELPAASRKLLSLGLEYLLQPFCRCGFQQGLLLLGGSFAGGLAILYLVQGSAHEVAPRCLANMVGLGAHPRTAAIVSTFVLVCITNPQPLVITHGSHKGHARGDCGSPRLEGRLSSRSGGVEIVNEAAMDHLKAQEE